MKKFGRFLLCASMIIALAACSGAKEKEPASQETQSVESISESGESTSTQSSTVDEKPQISAMELFEQFLAGEAKVKKGEKEYDLKRYDGKSMPLYVPYVDDDGYTLKGLVARAQEADNAYAPSIYTSYVNYRYLDLGDDGEPELLLEVGHGGGAWDEARDFLFVIGKVDDGLQLLYMGMPEYGNAIYFANGKGLLITYNYYGSSEYASPMEYGFLDAKGDYHKLFEMETYYAMGTGCDATSGVPAAADKIVAEEGEDFWFDGIEYRVYRIGENASKSDEIHSFYSYDSYYEEEKNERQRKLAEQAFGDAGVEYQPVDSVLEKIESYAKQMNAPADIMQEEEYGQAYKDLDRDAFWPGSVETVSDVESMMKALHHNSMILLEPGTYDVTKWIEANEAKISPYEYDEDYQGNRKSGISYMGSDTETYELVLSGLYGIVIGSADPSNPARIVCDAPYSRVIYFENCANISLENVIMGHEVEHGYCAGDVLGFDSTQNINIVGCDIYGCGVYGLGVYQCDQVLIQNTKIHDCTQGCIAASYSNWVILEKSTFCDCDGGCMFSGYVTAFTFIDCSFKRLNGEILDLYNGGEYAYFSDCQFDAAVLERLQNDDDYSNVIIY